MNHILWLTNERADLQRKLENIHEQLIDLECYLLSDKFAWPDNDYVHVKTDILPKIAAVRFLLIQG